jgi:hypothetical protein
MLHQCCINSFFFLDDHSQNENSENQKELIKLSPLFLFFPLIVMRDFGHSSSGEECQQSTDCREVMIELCKTNKR